nr:hypothetical protein [Tanacetum cinerariifolium]
DYPHRALKDKAIVNSGCSSHMTGNKAHLADYREFKGSYVTFGGSNGRITGKFDGKSNSGFLAGYSINSKAFRVYNLETKRVEENLHVNFLENKPNVSGKGHARMFDLDYLTNFINYEHVLVENQANKFAGPKEANNSAGTQANDDQGANSEEINLNEEHFVLPIWSAYSANNKSFWRSLRSFKDKGKGILIEEPKSLKGQAQIEQDEAFTRQLEAELNANINWNVVIEKVKRSERLNDAVIKYQALKRKPLIEAQERKNMIIYLKNMAGYKMNYFKGMTYNEIRPLFEKCYNYNKVFLEEVNEEVTVLEKEVEVEGHRREGKSLEKEITKKQKIDEEAEELRSHLQTISNDDDNIYTKATPLASKIPIIDYKIHHERNKP